MGTGPARAECAETADNCVPGAPALGGIRPALSGSGRAIDGLDSETQLGIVRRSAYERAALVAKRDALARQLQWTLREVKRAHRQLARAQSRRLGAAEGVQPSRRLASRARHPASSSRRARSSHGAELRILARAVARGISTIAGWRAICGERNHERFNCEPLASSAHSRRQWSQQVQRF